VPVKIALPKGRLLVRTGRLLDDAGWGLDEYHEQARLYRLKSTRFPRLAAKIFHERDIPVQVAIGNYDLGICGLDWIEELLAKYPSSALVKIKDLGYEKGTLYVASSPFEAVSTSARVKAGSGTIRIASEYPNLAESYALSQRLRRFSIFPVWGGAEVYPPENANLVLVRCQLETELESHGMVPISRMLDYSAFLIANRRSWGTKDLNQMVASICESSERLPPEEVATTEVIATMLSSSPNPAHDGLIRLALPDGHQQAPMRQLLHRAGIEVEDYPSAAGNRRPKIDLEGVAIKVVRPQDMPLQVANGNFDLAVTGRDWLKEHLNQFPSSPVRELLDLKSGKVRMVAVVSQTLPVDNAYDLRRLTQGRAEPFRIASEYVNIADRYARDNHLGRYRVVPTWGATEAFLPEDADLLIENTETGRTIARHSLKIIDTLFESTACLIGGADFRPNSNKGRIMKTIIDRLRTAVESD
jgi:ATP phosphoribosyltransferase